MKKLSIIFALFASPAFAASGPFFSLGNTDFVVLLGFVVFVGILIYFKVPGMIVKMLDDRSEGIKSDLDDAKSIREEAQALLASYERKKIEVQEQAQRIVASAKHEAEKAAEQAKADITSSVARRVAAAEEQITAAQAAAVKEVRDQAIIVAVDAARSIVTSHMNVEVGDALIDDAIVQVSEKLH